MNIIERTKFAMEHFMSNHPDEQTKYGRRGHFDVRIIPEPDYFRGGQWSDGDLTSRALDAWIFARKITGDYVTGRDVEEEQWKYFLNCIHPETGLIFVRDHSFPNRDGYYYHLWDQGRALRHMVHRYTLTEMDADEKAKLHHMIEAMLNGCLRLSSTAVLDDGNTARFWETDTYFDEKPIDRTLDFGRENFIDFTIGCAQLLEPVVKFHIAVQDNKYLELAIELANGFIAGIERRRGSVTPMFGPEGEFAGHFHTAVSGLTGLVLLAKQLHCAGNTPHARKYIDLAIQSYQWIFSPNNINRGSSSGWFPEGTGPELTDNSELCCTADMIEFAASLAELSEWFNDYKELDKLWDDVDRFTINELYAMQILQPEKLRQFLPEDNKHTMDEFEKQVNLCEGGWAASRVWPHEMLKIRGNERIFYTIGCCLYSGARGFYSYWNSMVSVRDEEIHIRFSGRYSDEQVDIDELEGGGMRIQLSADHKLIIRIPETADYESVSVVKNGEIEQFCQQNNRRIVIDGKSGCQYDVCWEKIRWTSKEKIGIVNDGYVRNAKIGEQVEFSFVYDGNKLIDMEPKEDVTISVFEGL